MHIHSNTELSPVVESQYIIIPRCTICKNEMEFVVGDVIYGDKWYHKSCWKEVEEFSKIVAG